MQILDLNDLPLRRRVLYPAELLRHVRNTMNKYTRLGRKKQVRSSHLCRGKKIRLDEKSC